MSKEEKKTIELDYEFNSWYDEDYEEYDGDEFKYKIGYEDAKDTICVELAKVIKCDNSQIIYKTLEELHSWECVDWDKIIENCEDLLRDHYEKEAMEWFIDEHYIETKEDYEWNKADAYNDEKWLEEHGE